MEQPFLQPGDLVRLIDHGSDEDHFWDFMGIRPGEAALILTVQPGAASGGYIVTFLAPMGLSTSEPSINWFVKVTDRA